MSLNVGTVIREDVPVGLHNFVLLDRSGSEAFVVSPIFLDMIDEFAPGGLRIFTTGHDNLARSHPMSLHHSYVFAAFTNTEKGNLWDPDWLGGPLGTHVGAPASETITLAAYKFILAHAESLGRPMVGHWFLDAQAGFSEGYQNPHAPGYPIEDPALQDLQWYEDPDPYDLDGNSILGASKTALEWKILENKRLIQDIMTTTAWSMVINVGGEDWRGLGDLSEPPNTWPPWDISDGDPDSAARFAWISSIIHANLEPLHEFVTAKGWKPRVKFAVGFLESVQSGKQFPLAQANIDRDIAHFDGALSLYGPLLDYSVASCHYRGDWSRFLREEQMNADFTKGLRIAFPVNAADWPGAVQGTASYGEIGKWIPLKYGAVYPNLRMGTMADSVGDAARENPPLWIENHHYEVGDEITRKDAFVCVVEHDSTTKFFDDVDAGYWDPLDLDVSLPDWQRGLIATQMKIEKICSELDLCNEYPGFTADHGIVDGQNTAGFNPREGHTGSVEGVFEKFPIYHATKTFGPVLHKHADVLEMTDPRPGIVQLAMGYTEAGEYRVAIWLINKLATGAPGSEVGQAQSFPITINSSFVSPIITVCNVRLYSETQQTNDLVASPGALVMVSGRNLVCSLPAFSHVSFLISIAEGVAPLREQAPRIVRALAEPQHIIRALG